MSASLLKHENLSEGAQSIISTIELSARRGADVVKQVLTFARGAGGERTLTLLKHLVPEIVAMISETFPRNIRIRTRCEPDLWPVNANSTQLHQALMNLCVNARDAMRDGGELTVHLQNTLIDEGFPNMSGEERPGPYCRISVSDTGTGISKEMMGKIFDPFFTTKELGKGTGLGLSTVLGIVRGHGGFLRVTSEEGRGTCFDLYIPATVKQLDQGAPVPDDKTPEGEGQSVLVVDDEGSIRDSARRVLEKHGYRVLLANEGVQAVGLFVQHRSLISIVITDMMMPGMDGPSLVKVLRRVNPLVRIIGMSGVIDAVQEREIEALRMDAFLVKPFTREKLLATLHEAIRGGSRASL